MDRHVRLLGLGLLFALCTAATTTRAGTWVGEDGGYVLVQPGDVQSKQDLAALLATYPAGTDFRFEGGWYRMMDGPDPVLLRDEDSGKTIEAKDPTDPPIFEGDPAMKIEDGSGFLAVPWTGSLHGFTIRNVVMEHFDFVLQLGAQWHGPNPPAPGVVEDVTVEHSQIDDFGRKGMFLSRCQRCVIRDNQFTSDQPQDGNADAMAGGNEDLIVIEGNVVDSQAQPLNLQWTTRALVVGNTFRTRQRYQPCSGFCFPGSIGVIVGLSTDTFFGASCPQDQPDGMETFFDQTGSRFAGAFVDNDVETPVGPDYEPGWFCLGIVGPYDMQLLAAGNRCSGFPEAFAVVLQGNHTLLADNESEGATNDVDLAYYGSAFCGPETDNLAYAAQQDVVVGTSTADGNLALRPSDLGGDRKKVDDLVARVEAERPDGDPAAAADAYLDLYGQLGRALCTAEYGDGDGAPRPCDAAPWAPGP